MAQVDDWGRDPPRSQQVQTPLKINSAPHTPQTITTTNDSYSAAHHVANNSSLSSDFWDLTERYERVSEEWKKDALLLRQREKEVVQTGEMQKDLQAELRGVHELVLHLREEVRVAASERAQSQSLLHTSQKQCVQLSEELRKLQVAVHVEHLRNQEVEEEYRSRLLSLEKGQQGQQQTDAQLRGQIAQALGDIDGRLLTLEGTVADSAVRDSSTRGELEQITRRMREVEDIKVQAQHRENVVIPTRPSAAPRTALAHPARQRYTNASSDSAGVAALVQKLRSQVECGVMEELSLKWAASPQHRIELRRLMVIKHALDVVKGSRSHILRCEGLRLLQSLAVDEAGTVEILNEHLGGVPIARRLADPLSTVLERKWSTDLLATMCM
jgi:hypothetical protein